MRLPSNRMVGPISLDTGQIIGESGFKALARGARRLRVKRLGENEESVYLPHSRRQLYAASF